MHHLGDVVISYEQVIAQAQADETTPKAVLVALIVHGFLHLLGYDHETETEAYIMEEKETEILATLNSI
jgi:probable rRNA maturation factor